MSLETKLKELFPDNDIARDIVLAIHPDKPPTVTSILQCVWKSISIPPLENEDTTSTVITDSIIKCYKCGQHSVSWTQAQLRSADEGESYICKCTNPQCRNSWIM